MKKTQILMKKMTAPCIHCGGPKMLLEHFDTAKEVDTLEQRCLKCKASGTLERQRVDARAQLVSDAMKEMRFKFREDQLEERDRKGII